jgi:phosphoserine aminotransferase
MKKIFFTVGPSQLYPTVPNHIKKGLEDDIPSLSHRSQKFMDIYKSASDNLRKLLNIPPSHHIFFLGSALEGMERTILNTVCKKSLHFVNGSFSREFYQIAVDLKKNPERIDAPNGEGYSFESIKVPKDTELFCIVQNETSTGVSIPMEYIYTLKKNYPSVLIAIDVVSSIPYTTIDFSLIDIAIFSVQKGFGLPAGLGVLIVNERALEKADWIVSKGMSIGSYHSFQKLLEFEQKYQTRETPNIQNIYLLSKVTKDMLKVGIDKIRKDTEIKAALLYDYFEEHKTFGPYVNDPYRSKTTLVIDVNGQSDSLVKKLSEKGFIIAKGYGKRKDRHIRIGNFPAHTLSQVKSLLQNIE